MKAINVMLSNLDGKVIPIGYEGENMYTRVRINCVEIFTEYPDATVSMVISPPTGSMYPAVIEKSGVMVVWDITKSILSSNGSGSAQLTFKDGETEIKSVIFGLSINRSLIADGEPPEPVQEWIDRAEETAHQIALTAKDEVIEQIQDAAEEARESIPSDYTQLSDDVTSLKSALSKTEQLDLAFVQGNVSGSTGKNANSSSSIRTNEYYNVANVDTVTITFTIGSYASGVLTVFKYGELKDEAFIGKTSYTAGTYMVDVSDASFIRFVILRASSDTSTVFDPADGPSLLTVSYVGLIDLTPDTTLSVAGKAADAKSTGDAISAIRRETKSSVSKKMKLEWQRGRISSSSGNNSQSSSTTYIRTAYKYKISAGRIHLDVPTNTSVEVYGYTKESNDAAFIAQIGVYTASTDIDFAETTYIRLVASYTDLSDIPLSAGDDVIISYDIANQSAFEGIVDDMLADYSSLSMFQTFGVIGDSWASGSIHTPSGYVDTVYPMSWGQILARKIGATAANYSKGGLSTKTWLTDSTGLSALQADTPKQLYIINLGINDNTQITAGTLSLGSIDDVNVADYTQNPDTFFGNYGRIIGNIIAHAPKAVILLLSIARPGERNMDEYVKQIAEKYGLPFIDLTEDAYFISGWFYGAIYDGHMSAYGYSGMANAIQRLIQRHIVKHGAMFAYYDGLLT